MWLSISIIFSILEASINGDVILFSTAKTTPSDVWIPIAVEPSYKYKMWYDLWCRTENDYRFHYIQSELVASFSMQDMLVCKRYHKLLIHCLLVSK